MRDTHSIIKNPKRILNDVKVSRQLGCYFVSTGTHFRFRCQVGQDRPLELLDIDNKGTETLRNVSNYLPVDTAYRAINFALLNNAVSTPHLPRQCPFVLSPSRSFVVSRSSSGSLLLDPAASYLGSNLTFKGHGDL